jgi:DNA-binding transcriptional regulator YhcF (GntR family)
MLAIDPGSSVPPFEQLRVQLLERVSSGELAPGAKLPTVRQLADDLGLAPNTVARCYRELERDQIIQTRGRNGSYVSAHGDAAHREAQAAARDFTTRIRQLGIEEVEALAIVTAALRS